MISTRQENKINEGLKGAGACILWVAKLHPIIEDLYTFAPRITTFAPHITKVAPYLNLINPANHHTVIDYHKIKHVRKQE